MASITSSSEFHSFNSAIRKFDDPFITYSDEFFPTNLGDALDYSRYLYHLLPMYKRSSERVVRHFITTFRIDGEASQTEKKDFKAYLNDDLRLKGFLTEAGSEERTYGNCFVRLYFPFDRHLIDTRGGTTRSWSLPMFPEEHVTYHYKDMEYEVPDPTQSRKAWSRRDKVRMTFRDIPNKDKKRIKIKKVDPRWVSIQFSHANGKKRIIYRFEQFLRQDVKDGKLFQVNELSRGMLKALAQDRDYRFKENAVFHMMTPMISGISYYGWGLPEPIANFRTIYQMQIYRKADEAFALDSIRPFKVITPSDNGTGSIMQHTGMRKWTAAIRAMVRRKRQDPTSIHALPHQADYAEWGNDEKKIFVTKDLMKHQQDELMRAAGYPSELFEGSLRIQMVPTALRLFENQHWHIMDGFNRMSMWAGYEICKYMCWAPMQARLVPPSLAEDIDKQGMRFQLGMAGDLPRTDYMGSSLGIDDPVKKKEERIDEDMEIEELKAKKIQEYEQKQRALVEGGDPITGEGGTTPMDKAEQAQQEADHIMSLPTNQHKAALQALKGRDFDLYAMAKQHMEDARSQGASDGIAAVNQQAQEGG